MFVNIVYIYIYIYTHPPMYIYIYIHIYTYILGKYLMIISVINFYQRIIPDFYYMIILLKHFSYA